MTTPDPISTGSIYFLDDKTQSELMEQAQRGDTDAAFRLAQYFTLINKNDDEALTYLLMGAQYGDVHAQYRVAGRFFRANNYEHALLWAREAKRNGVADIDEFVDVDEFIEEIESAMASATKRQ